MLRLALSRGVPAARRGVAAPAQQQQRFLAAAGPVGYGSGVRCRPLLARRLRAPFFFARTCANMGGEARAS